MDQGPQNYQNVKSNYMGLIKVKQNIFNHIRIVLLWQGCQNYRKVKINYKLSECKE